MPDAQSAPHHAFRQPADPNIGLWRYMDWFKFTWLLESSRLYMPSLEGFADKLEGTAPRGEVDWWEKTIQDAESPEQRAIIASNQRKIAGFARMFRPHYYVSCWHMNRAENPRMWAEYTKGVPAVAIRTTLAKLRRALPVYVEIGVVRYIDYTKDRLAETFNMFEYVMHKNAGPYAFEQELRAVALPPIEQVGPPHEHFMQNFFECEGTPSVKIFAPVVDPAALLDAVVMHPASTAEHWAQARALCAQYALPSPVRSVVAVVS